MASNGQAQDWRRLAPMVVAAVALHGLLLLVVVPARQHAYRPTLELQWVEMARPESAVPAPSDMKTQEDERPPDLEPTPEPIAPSTPTAVVAAPAPDQDDPAEQAPSVPSAQRLRELALIAAQAQAERATPSSPGVEGAAAPRLPGTAGWLNDYVGTVTPHADSWLEADGAGASRVVTASGQVYCGRVRAPTAAEEFNPWMSAAVMTWRPCGRKRPEPIDHSDPWVRGQGSRQR